MVRVEMARVGQSKSMRDSEANEPGMSKELERDAVATAEPDSVPDEDLSYFEREDQSEEEAKIDPFAMFPQEEQNARICFVRRAIEQHMEQRQLQLELNYMDLETQG